MFQKTGNEHFSFDGMPTDFLLNDFWRWQASDLLNNTLRGALAEFIVAKALKIETKAPRMDWGAYDLIFSDRDCDRIKSNIEVKASAYIQSWEQKRNSKIIFSISPARAWDSIKGYEEVPKRHSDMYVFCLFAEKERLNADPLILDQWEFYPVLTSELDSHFPNQQTIGLPSVLRLCPEPYDYYVLRDAVLWLGSGYRDLEAFERIEQYRALKATKNRVSV